MADKVCPRVTADEDEDDEEVVADDDLVWAWARAA